MPVAQSARSPDKPWFTTEPGLPNDAEKLCYAFLVANIDWDVGRLCRPRLQRGGGRDEVACAAAWEVEYAGAVRLALRPLRAEAAWDSLPAAPCASLRSQGARRRVSGRNRAPCAPSRSEVKKWARNRIYLGL